MRLLLEDVAEPPGSMSGPAPAGHRPARSPPPAGSCPSSPGTIVSAGGRDPDAPVVHEPNLALDHLLPVLGVLHGLAVQVEVLRVDGIAVQELVELGPEVLHPVVPPGPGPVVPQGLDVDHPGHVGRARSVLLPADDLPAVVDDERLAAEGVDGGRLLGEEVV